MVNLMGQMQKALQERPQGALSSNTEPNPRADIKAITTRSGNVLAGPAVPPPPLSFSEEEVEQEQETITDQVLPENTIRVPHPVVQSPPTHGSSEIPPPPLISFEPPKRNPHQPLIPYPSSLAEALALMPKYHKMLKELLSDKEKLLGLANTSLTENCLVVLLKKLPEKLRDPGRFLIPCDFQGLESCTALVDLGASINLMPLSVWNKLSLPDLTPTRMTLELATRSIAYPANIAEDVCIQVALVNVYGKELILRDGDEKLIFHADSTSKHLQKHGNKSINMINFINITCEDRFPEVLNIKKSNHPFSGSTTSPSDSSPRLILFETIDSLLEEFADELALLDPFPPGNEDDNFDPEANLREIEYLLNRDPSTDSLPTTVINIIDPIFERFTDELDLVYSYPPGEDDDDNDDLFDLKTQIFNDESKANDLKVNTSSEAPSILEERNFPSISSDQELLSHLELSVTETLLSFSSENEDKVFNPGILTSKGVHSLTLGLSHLTYETFKIINVHLNIFNEGPMKIFPFFFFCPKDKGIQGESS
ncbi:reverse transcriptase domain-containing protein [Tanacetum coccineum]